MNGTGQEYPPLLSPAAIHLTSQDLRFRRRLAPAGRLLLFVVDASRSMAGQRRIAFAKGAIEALLLDAYRRRDRVTMIAFRGSGAELVLPPTNSADLAHRRARDLSAGGRTPLAAALTLARRVVAGRADWAQGGAPIVIVLSDGRANVALDGGDPWDDAVRAAARLRQSDVVAAVVDVGGGFDLGITAALGQALGAPCFRLPLLAPSPAAMPVRWS
jgi:magnesium chelatase subunit D